MNNNISSSGRISVHLKSDTIQGREVDVYQVLVGDEGLCGWRAYWGEGSAAADYR